MSSQQRSGVDHKSPAVNARYIRKIQRQKKSTAAAALMELSQVDYNECQEPDTGVPCQTDVDQPLYLAMNEELQSLRSENIDLKEQVLTLSNTHKIEEYEGNDDKVKYFTGLPTFTVLLALFHHLKPALPKKQTLDTFQILIMSLMRMRLNLPVQFLGFEFGISPSTVSRYFIELVNIMYVRLKPVIQWPGREQLRKTMPVQFRMAFGDKIAVIIDCFEIFIERPSNLLARGKTWSNYKHHHTAKYLIGITPQGSVSYISKGWGGRTSDKYITEHSGFMSHINPGDIVMADRGFDIGDSLACIGAVAKIPAFTKGRDQLSALDVESTRKLASCRIHVERVIGLVRQKFTMLSGTLPIDLVVCRNGESLTTLDKVVYVTCCLANMCPSVVNFD